MERLTALVIDDERESRDGLIRIVPWAELGIAEVFEAKDGEQGMSAIMRHKPDLIFTDIIMPKTNGLELLRSINRSRLQTKTIIISGYDNFDYAREALRLGAYDYILKPFRTSEVLKVAASCVEDIRIEHLNSMHELQEKDVYEYALNQMQDKLIQDLLFNRFGDLHRLTSRLELAGLGWITSSEKIRVIAIEIDNIQNISLKNSLLENKKLFLFTAANVIKDTISDKFPYFLTCNDSDQLILTCGTHGSLKESKDICSKMITNINLYAKFPVTIGIGPETDFPSVSLSYARAVETLEYKSIVGGNLAIFCDEVLLSDTQLTAETPIEQHIFAFIKTGIHDNIDELKEGVTALIKSWGTMKREDLLHHIFEWLLHLERQLKNVYPQVKVISENPIKQWKYFSTFDTFNSIIENTIAYLNQMCSQIKTDQNKRLGLITTQALKIIEDYYTKDITLNFIAERAYVSPVWLSHLLKEKTGKTFLTIVTEMRMEKAKVLLQDITLKIYEIPEKVGYKNIDYFFKLFKKHTALTPKQYRDSYK